MDRTLDSAPFLHDYDGQVKRGNRKSVTSHSARSGTLAICFPQAIQQSATHKAINKPRDRFTKGPRLAGSGSKRPMPGALDALDSVLNSLIGPLSSCCVRVERQWR